ANLFNKAADIETTIGRNSANDVPTTAEVIEDVDSIHQDQPKLIVPAVEENVTSIIHLTSEQQSNVNASILSKKNLSSIHSFEEWKQLHTVDST
ncbi:unnamed protein product, partial [Didymodactylos carnosus]